MSLPDAYARCEAIAAAHYENFPVASRLLPASMRPHVAAVYAFARAADDFADEGDAPVEDRLARIAQWRALRAGGAASASSAPRVGDVPEDDVRAIFLATHDTIVRCALEPTLFDDLLSAFAQDVTTTRYATWDDVLDYCRRSANPVGRLVLGIAGVADTPVMRQSDAVCTALQLANFWQDLGDDWLERQRLYVPMDLLAAHGATTDALETGQPDRAWRHVLDDAMDRTMALFEQGRPVADAVSGRLRYELRATWLGGTTILARTRALRRHSLHARPVVSRADLVRIAVGTLIWR